MKDFKFPRLGLRNVKTTIAVLVCMLIFKGMNNLSYLFKESNGIIFGIIYFILNRQSAIFACIEAVVDMQISVEDSKGVGKSRVWGGVIGSVFGLGFLWIDTLILNRKFSMLFVTLGTATSIYFCNLINRKNNSMFSAVIFLIIMIGMGGNHPFLYAINRIIDMIIGMSVAIFVNLFIAGAKENSK